MCVSDPSAQRVLSEKLGKVPEPGRSLVNKIKSWNASSVKSEVNHSRGFSSGNWLPSKGDVSMVGVGINFVGVVDGEAVATGLAAVVMEGSFSTSVCCFAG